MANFRMHEIRELVKLIDESQITEFELNNDGSKIVIKKMNSDLDGQYTARSVEFVPEQQPVIINRAESKDAPQEKAVESKADVDDSSFHKITSPMVGTFYRAASPDSSPYVTVGDRINTKSVVCIVEAMKLMNEIESEVSGQVVEILAENGQIVEYGQPLMLIKT